MGYTIKELETKLEKYSSKYVDKGVLGGELDDKEMENLKEEIENLKKLIKDRRDD